MRSVFMLTILLALLTVGYLVIQNVGSHTQKSENGRVEEIERARQTAAQAEQNLDTIRRNVNPGDQQDAHILP